MSLQILWQTFYRNIPWVVPYQTYRFCPNLWIWLVIMATKRLNFRKIFKCISSEAIIGIKLKLCRNVHNISIYKKIVFYCYCSCTFVAMTYNRKSENGHLLLSHCRYFDKSFSEIFVVWSSTKLIILVQTSQIDGLVMATKRLNFWKKKKRKKRKKKRNT